jgi:hypothetical protein
VVGVLDEAVGRVAVVREAGDADAAGDRQAAAGHLEGFRQAGHDLAGGVLAETGVWLRVHRHDELVAAQARDGVFVAEQAPQAAGDLAEQQVAHVVAEVVVDRLEVVQVDEEHRHLGVVAAGAAQHAVDAVGQQGPVGQAGEAVEVGLVPHLLVLAAQLGDVGEQHHAAHLVLVAVGHRGDHRVADVVAPVGALAIEIPGPVAAAGLADQPAQLARFAVGAKAGDGLPSRAPGLKPVMAQKAGLTRTMRSSASTTTMPSAMCSTMWRECASCWASRRPARS